MKWWQVSSAVVDVNGDSSGHSSPAADAQHTYITVASEYLIESLSRFKLHYMYFTHIYKKVKEFD
jgi:hypothetical protein